MRRPGLPELTRLRLRYGHEVTLRTYSTDPDVFRQVFLDAQYALPTQLPQVRRIIDAGANIGLSSLYFLIQHPSATVIALEPDPANYDLARANTAAFRDRCRVLPVALWSHRSALALVDGGAAWAISVRDATVGEPVVSGMSLAEIMAEADWASADLVKIDIEGAEVQVLAAETPASVAAAKCWAIELHSDRARAAFAALFGAGHWNVVRRGEIDFACAPART